MAGHGLPMEEQRLFGGKLTKHPLLAGLNEGDVFLKAWHTLDVVVPGGGWQVIAEPGLVALDGDRVVCALDPAGFEDTRARIKAIRVRTMLAVNAGIQNPRWNTFLSTPLRLYEENAWETIPPYINW